MDTLAEGKQKYTMILCTLNDYCGFLFFFFSFFKILICNPRVIGDNDSTVPLVLMAPLDFNGHNSNDIELSLAFQRSGYSYLIPQTG